MRLCAGDVTSKEVVNRLADGGRAWVNIKKDWLEVVEDSEEVHATGAVSLMKQGLDVEVAEEIKQRLARHGFFNWGRIFNLRNRRFNKLLMSVIH